MVIIDLLNMLNNQTGKKTEYDKFYKDNIKRFNSKIYKWKDSFIYHILVPTGKTNHTYDVLLEIKTESKKSTNGELSAYKVNIFSNSPSFVYSDIKSYIDKDTICLWALPRINYDTKRESKDSEYHLDKSLYLALMYLYNNRLLSYSTAVSTGINISSRNTVLNTIKNIDQIKTDREDKDNQIKNNNFSNKANIKTTSKKTDSNLSNKLKVKTVSKTKTVSSTKTPKTTSKIKNIEKTKKV